ncbi:polysaccharide export outer membrane protein [Pedobacter sp. UYP30]|uniref:polysaccharide biosynthesis/export family protein n=1 Tax=Pedobacter sp. UYP30 TaxID=1756400 RepID=UPI00339720FE
MNKIIYLAILVLFLSSCGIKYETIPYLTDLPQSGNVSEEIQNQSILKIQKSDILSITVSSLDAQSDAYFNLGNIGTAQTSTSAVPNASPNGFIVDQTGNVQLPYLGAVSVLDLSTVEARKLIADKLQEGGFLTKPVVNLRLVNFKISVLGDVARSGVYPVQSERITVLEALGLAGDLTITAKRNDVLLLRESQGKRHEIRLNLQSKDLLNSPYYYLQNNDVLVVTPSAAKYASVDSKYRNASLIISALSVIALLITRL